MNQDDLSKQKNSSSMEIESSSRSNPNDTNDNETNPLFSELRIKRDHRKTSEKMKDHNLSEFTDNGTRSQDSIGIDENFSRQNSNISDNRDDEMHENNERSSLQLLNSPLHSSRSFYNGPGRNITSYLPPFNPPFRQENRLNMEESLGRNLPSIPSNNLSNLASEDQNQNQSQNMETEHIEENPFNNDILRIHDENNQELRNGVLIVRTTQPGPDGASIVLMRIIPMNEIFGRAEENLEAEENGLSGLFGMLLGLMTGLHGQRGLDKETLESLPVVKYDTESFQHVEPESKKCPICFDDYVDGNEIKYLWCLHRFHKNCVDHWLQNHISCPICKVDYSPVEKTELA